MRETSLRTERRVFERISARCPVRFKAEKANLLAKGSSTDFSDGGIGLFTRQKLEPDIHLEMWIRLSSQIKPLHIGGRVVWAKQSRPRLWRVGICFDQVAYIKIVKMLVSKNLN